jgi:hypothetical protein
VLVLVVATVATHGGEADDVGGIKGQLADPRGQSIRAGNAVVFLCDATSGMPLSPVTQIRIELGSEAMFRFDGYWHAVVSDAGMFEFADVPVGTYRLIAQAWSGISGVPRGLPRSRRSDPGVEPSSIVILHGVAESVEVKAGETTLAIPQQWGDNALHIVTDPEEPHNFLLISRNPPLGDGVLGPEGWGEDFIAGIIGGTRMEDNHVTLIGLPDGAEVHVALWNYDNSVGTGGESFVVGKDKPARLPIYALWSNGKYEPPPRLAELTAHIEETGLDVRKSIGLDRPSLTHDYLDRVWNKANDVVELEGYGISTVIDLLAADGYRNLRKSHREQEQRRAEQKAK